MATAKQVVVTTSTRTRTRTKTTTKSKTQSNYKCPVCGTNIKK